MAAARLLPSVKRTLRPFLVPRRFHAFGVGTGKSGTTSLARIMRANYRSSHEAGAHDLIRHIRFRSEGSLSPRRWRRSIVRRDRRLWLEMETSQLLVEALDDLVELFPEARFVLTIRHPYSWLMSAITQELTQPIDDAWRWWADYRYERRGPTPPQSLPLTELGLYRIDAYLDFWARHNQRVLDTVAPSRLLVIRTDTLSDRLADLAGFLDVPVETLDASSSHSRSRSQSASVLSRLDDRYIREQIQERCGGLLDRYFPDETGWTR